MYIYLNLCALIIIVIMFFLSFKHIGETYLIPFRLVMIFTGLWTISSILELFYNTYQLKLFFINLTQFSMACASLANYWFVITYTGLENDIYKFILKIFLFLNTLAMLLLFSDPLHHLLRSYVQYSEINGVLEFLIIPSSLGYFFIGLRFLLFGFATLLLVGFLFKTYKNMRQQVLVIAISFFLALVLLLLQQYLFINFDNNFPMSVILIIPYIAVGIGIFKYDFLSISPIANEWIIDSLDDGIIILSNEGVIVDQNPAAANFLNLFATQVDIPKLMTATNDYKDSVEKLIVTNNHEIHYYKLIIHRLLTQQKLLKGSVGVIKDITLQTRHTNELIAKANIDGLTQVYNKAAFENIFDSMQVGPVSLLIIDIDNFKDINDNYGHPIGDKVLFEIVNVMQASIRNHDFIGRIGGDEFCIALSECSEKLCASISQRLLHNISNYTFETAMTLPKITVSIGGITHNEVESISFKNLYVKADEVLYVAKKQGKNQIVFA